MKYTQKTIPEGINTSNENPLKELVILTTGVVASVVLLITLLSYLLDWLTPYIPFEYEQKLAEPFLEEVMSAEKGRKVSGVIGAEETINRANDVTDYLQRLADQITVKMQLPDETTITVHYIDENVVNAMATIGGHVFIYRGLLKALKSENEVVALLGHEIAHVKFRHPLKALNKGVIISLLIAIVGGQSSHDVSAFFMDTQMLTLLTFSREQEQDADNEAFNMSYNQYQHSQGLIELFKVLSQQGKQKIASLALLNSHPDIAQRIARIVNQSKLKHWPTKGKLIPIPEKVMTAIHSKTVE